MKRIEEECYVCGGTGLYSGFMEGEGEAVVCIDCNGKGWRYYNYSEFTGRKNKRGIKLIKKSQGKFIATGVGGFDKSMTYAEFKKKYPVAKDKKESA